MAEDHRIEYNWIEGVETLEDYRPGGYHPMMIGDILYERYCIIDKLGFGGYATVWLAHDTRKKHYVALKVNRADALSRETKTLKAVSNQHLSSSTHPGTRSISALLDEFEVQGPNGTHACHSMTLAACNLREISFSRLFPLEVARALSYALAQAVAYTHSQGYAHGDIHLRNILVKLPGSFDTLSIQKVYEKYGEPETVPITQCNGQPIPPNVPAQAVLPLFLGKYAEDCTLSDAHLLLSDFGEAFSPVSENRLGQDCHTPPAFRAPETTFEPLSPLTYASDIWSLATAIWETVGMKAIFSTEFVPEDEIIAQHVDVLGPMPEEWWSRWEARSQFFDENGSPTDSYRENQWAPLEESFEFGIQKYRRERGSEMEEDEKTMFLNMMRQMLVFRPEDRLKAEDVLKSEWMVKWALPDYDRSQTVPH